MKTMKGFITGLLAVAMLLTSMTAFAYECYPVYGKAVISDFMFFDSQGGEITSIPADGKVVVSCNITKGSNVVEQSAILLAVAYDKNRAVAIGTESKALADTAQGFSVTLENVAPGNTVKAFVWDGLALAEPLASVALLGGSNASLMDISVDGRMIDGFSADKTEYNIVFPASYTKVPDISARAYELSSDVSIAYAYTSENTLKATIDVTSQDDKSEKTYVVSCTYTEPEITDVIAKATGGEVTVPLKTAANPVYKVQPSVAPSAAASAEQRSEYLAANCVSFNPLYQLRDFYMYNIPEYLEGAQYAYINYDYRNDAAYYGNTSDALSFKINRSANVYLVALYSNNPSDYMTGWSATGDKLGVVCVNGVNWDSWREPSIYQKYCEVSGDEPVTVCISGLNRANNPQFVPFIVFDETEKMEIIDENTAYLTGITIDGVKLDSFNGDTFGYTLNEPASYKGDYDVVGIPANKAAKITYSDSESEGNKVKTINVDFGNGQDVKTYVLTFVKSERAITEAKAYIASGAIDLTFGTANEPVYKAQPSKTPEDALNGSDADKAEYSASNCESYSKFYTAREFYMYNLPQQLVGSQYTLNSYDYRNDAAFNNEATDAMSFELNSSATIYVTSLWNKSPAWLTDSGFTKADETIDCIEAYDASIGAVRRDNILWSKKVEVGINETQTVHIGGMGAGAPQAVAFIVWED